MFVRLTYCNLRCSYCDTEYAFYEGRDMTLQEICEQVASFRCGTVEVTGGEPLLQDAVHELLRLLCDQHAHVLLETSGSQDISPVDPRVIKIVDMKCPSSRMADKNDYENLRRLGPQDELKFVIGGREDYDWAVELMRRYSLFDRVILLSPVFDSVPARDIVEWMLEDGLQTNFPNIRFQLQMHKFIWTPETRGV